jgi:H/ACA ribonucleoprotein complex non-core subunit NAF1
MYQVKFNSSFPLDLNEARVSRPIFHVPARSNYVFLSELAILRGSDASNVHDEEPAEYELEFSDDEAEAAHKARLRQRSVSFSFAWQ